MGYLSSCFSVLFLLCWCNYVCCTQPENQTSTCFLFPQPAQTHIQFTVVLNLTRMRLCPKSESNCVPTLSLREPYVQHSYSRVNTYTDDDTSLPVLVTIFSLVATEYPQIFGCNSVSGLQFNETAICYTCIGLGIDATNSAASDRIPTTQRDLTSSEWLVPFYSSFFVLFTSLTLRRFARPVF
ncbi:GP3 envelope protein [Hedgehog arterivirus]|nr:GP3 envelope protein [Hedgehog arterivirus]